MASSSELGVSSSITKCDVVEYESLQTPPTLHLETPLPLADVYAGVMDSTSGSETDIVATETIYLSTSAYPMSDNNEAGNNEQHTDLKLDTPDNSLTQIFVLHQPASLTLTGEGSYQAFMQHETNIKLDEQMHTHVDEPGCSLENITEIEESSGIVLVMPGDCQLLSVNNSLPQCVEDKSIINRDVQTTKSPLKETSSMIKPGSTTTLEHQVCLQLVKEDVSTCSLNVIPGKLHDVKSESNCNTVSSETTVINNVPRDDRLFMCDLCSKTFNRPGNYKRHRMTHMVNTEEDPRYKCEVCNRPFLQRCDLKRHMQVHSGKEPFRCQVCNKGYIRRSDLVVHMRFHNKERLFKCDYCEKKFHQSGDLKRHVRLVHVKTTKLLCRHCDSRYATDTTFLRHMQTAHRDILLQSIDKVPPLDDPVADVSDNNSWRSDSKESSASADASPSGSKKELYEVSSSSSSISSSVSYTISSSFSS